MHCLSFAFTAKVLHEVSKHCEYGQSNDCSYQVLYVLPKYCMQCPSFACITRVLHPRLKNCILLKYYISYLTFIHYLNNTESRSCSHISWLAECSANNSKHRPITGHRSGSRFYDITSFSRRGEIVTFTLRLGTRGRVVETLPVTVDVCTFLVS